MENKPRVVNVIRSKKNFLSMQSFERQCISHFAKTGQKIFTVECGISSGIKYPVMKEMQAKDIKCKMNSVYGKSSISYATNKR